MATYTINVSAVTAVYALLEAPTGTAFETILNDGSDSSYVYNQWMLNTCYAYVTLDTPSGVSGTISSVKVYLRARVAENIGSNVYNVGIRIGNKNYMGTPASITLTGFFSYGQSWTTKPSTGSPWQWTDFSDTTYLFSINSNYGAANIICPAFYAEITYTPDTTTTYFVRNIMKTKRIP